MRTHEVPESGPANTVHDVSPLTFQCFSFMKLLFPLRKQTASTKGRGAAQLPDNRLTPVLFHKPDKDTNLLAFCTMELRSPCSRYDSVTLSTVHGGDDHTTRCLFSKRSCLNFFCSGSSGEVVPTPVNVQFSASTTRHHRSAQHAI